MFTIKTAQEIDGQTDALVYGFFNGDEKTPLYKELNEKMNGELSLYFQEGELSFSYKQVTKLVSSGKLKAKRLYILGLGKREALTVQKLRNAFGHLFKQLKVSNVMVHLDSFVTETIPFNEVAICLTEAMTLATYEQPTFKTGERKTPQAIDVLQIKTNFDETKVKEALEAGYAFGAGTNLARHLVHLPGNMLTATNLAERAVKLAQIHNMDYEVLEKEDMERLGMGALLAVNKGSTEPPKLIVLKYQGKEKWQDAIGLVGKGITFDTGGYSIKTKNGLMGMKSDMGGAAAVLGAMDIIGRLQPKQNVVAVIPSTDNMISGDAFKPDDVIYALSGKSIEVRNTDAEGRLALADGITYAKQQYQVDKLIDVATLTGGVITALGDKLTGAMTNNEAFYKEVEAAAEEKDEPIWLLPYNDHFKAQVRNSDIADLNNSPGRKGHAVLAGSFLAEFAEDTPWVHLDIAGTATTDTSYDLGPKGPTGIMARTLAHLVMKV